MSGQSHPAGGRDPTPGTHKGITVFQTDEADEESVDWSGCLRRRGHNKEGRDNQPQVIIALAVTRDGMPVRFVGETGQGSAGAAGGMPDEGVAGGHRRRRHRGPDLRRPGRYKRLPTIFRSRRSWLATVSAPPRSAARCRGHGSRVTALKAVRFQAGEQTRQKC